LIGALEERCKRFVAVRLIVNSFLRTYVDAIEAAYTAGIINIPADYFYAR
jgi:hypothetical protein